MVAQGYKYIEVILAMHSAAAHFGNKRGWNTGFQSQSLLGLCTNLSRNMLSHNASVRERLTIAAKISSGSLMIQVIIAQTAWMQKAGATLGLH